VEVKIPPTRERRKDPVHLYLQLTLAIGIDMVAGIRVGERA